MRSQSKSLLQPRVSRLALKAATRVRKATRAATVGFFSVGCFLSTNSGNAWLQGLAKRSGAFPGGSQGSRDTELAGTARVRCFH